MLRRHRDLEVIHLLRAHAIEDAVPVLHDAAAFTLAIDVLEKR